MFMHIFKTRLKCLLRDKQMIFWTLAFPLVLGTFFNMAFSNLAAHEKFEPVIVVVVDDDKFRKDKDFRAVLDEVSTGEDRLFNLTKTTHAEALLLLREGKAAGCILAGSEPELIVNGKGLSQNIIRIFLDNYIQTASAAASIIQENPSKAAELLKDLSARREYTREVTGSGAEPDNVLNYFYTLIAMACFYGGFFGNREVVDIQANLSSLAARVNISPVHKLKAFLSSISASLLIHFIEMLVLLAYLNLVLGIDFGTRIGLVLLTTLVGSVTGVSFGAFISSAVKGNENTKTAILIAVSMTGSFLAGMMFEDMKYIISQNAPLLSYLNPLNLLTDALYSLYYFNSLNRYILNTVILCGFAILFCTGTYLNVRRRKYASI